MSSVVPWCGASSVFIGTGRRRLVAVAFLAGAGLLGVDGLSAAQARAAEPVAPVAPVVAPAGPEVLERPDAYSAGLLARKGARMWR